ncbi:MAG TPA: beta-L-arabinofuranosidase domain-containing protein [Bacteroidales bacterium]|nr:beta-L-arabinofuranosidase domain-containing protein [Bacteroidales bacterium]
MKNILNSFLILIFLLLSGCGENKTNINYKGNPEGLAQNAFIQLPLGSIHPYGWLEKQLRIQAEGLTGNLDDSWPDLQNSAWRGLNGDAWERGPYYLDGLVPLAYTLNDEALKVKVKTWIDPILKSASVSGWYGPEKNTDRWPLAVSNKALMQYYEATGDTLALHVLINYFRYLQNNPPDWPDKEWRGVRAMENAVTGYWLYRQTGEEWITEVIKNIHDNSFDWTSYYEKFPWDSDAVAMKRIPLNWGAEGLTAHVVNNAMAIKYPGLWYQQSKDEIYRNAVYQGIKKYDLNHGQAGGRFSGDEHLSGKSPDKGTELCSIVEYMYSLEELFAVFGENDFADRLEYLAYNSLPGATTPDMWAHQYDQQSNQVLVSNAKRNWSTNGDESNIYGFSPNFGCCLANMHQGWPKFVSRMWMATNDNGIAIVAYGPSVVNAKVADGRDVVITEDTDYPFSGLVKLGIKTESAVKFPLYIRKPGWADSILVTYHGKTIIAKEGMKLKEKWHNGDTVLINIPMNIRTERRFKNSVSVLRGPLYYSLRIQKVYDTVRVKVPNLRYKGSIDWSISAESPWNYGLMIDPVIPVRGINVTENGIGKYPFADIGDPVWSADTAGYVINHEKPPVVIKTRGIIVPSWGMKDNSADIPPESPVTPILDPVVIELVPYGSARLRITEFPLMDVTIMRDVMRPSDDGRVTEE